jgi:DMSO reductase family type II enzyme heme b subunit
MAGSAVGNPMSTVKREQPLQELQAYGFGSSTDVPESPGSARGAWKDGRWYVVFERPNDSADPLVKRFNENPEQQLIALAVWDGHAQNRGGRKHITNWIPMRVEK